jgi:hypothetical protein
MNNLLKISLFVVFLLTSADVMSKDRDFSVSFGNVNSKTLSFKVNNAQNISLFVYNDNEGEIYSEKIGDQNFISKSYNLETLADGTYYLVAESDYKIEKYKISIQNKNLVVEKTPVSEIIKPEFTINNNIVKLNMEDMEGSVNVSVQDFFDNVYYNETKFSKDGKLSLTFKLDPNSDQGEHGRCYPSHFRLVDAVSAKPDRAVQYAHRWADTATGVGQLHHHLPGKRRPPALHGPVLRHDRVFHLLLRSNHVQPGRGLGEHEEVRRVYPGHPGRPANSRVPAVRVVPYHPPRRHLPRPGSTDPVDRPGADQR